MTARKTLTVWIYAKQFADGRWEWEGDEKRADAVENIKWWRSLNGAFASDPVKVVISLPSVPKKKVKR